MRPIPSAFIASILLILLPATEAFAYGEIDPAYSSTIPGWQCEREVAPLPNDSVLVGLYGFSAGAWRSAVGKVRSDGTLDPAWQGGVALLGGADLGAPTTILPLPDGGAIVATSGALTRLRADGSVDTAYGTNGHYGTAAGDPPIWNIVSAALEADGSVVVLTHQTVGFALNYSFFAHILADGTFDKAFGSNGEVGIPNPAELVYAWSVKDDGTVEAGFDEGTQHVLHRYPVDFTDADRPMGRVMPRAGVASWVGPSVLVDAAGGVVFASVTQNVAMSGLAGVELVRVLPEGSIDPGFGLQAAVPRPGAGQTTIGEWVQLSRSSDGKWMAFLDVYQTPPGFTPGTSAPKRYAMRFGADGRPDPGFSITPLITSPIFGVRSARLNTGKLVAMGGTASSCQLQRLLTDGEPRVDGILVEYYHPVLRHYFLTLDTFEAAIVDSNPGGWTRTGRTFAAWQPVPAPATTAVCRFYGDPVIGPNSHFYTPEGSECDGLIALQQSTPPGVPVWHLEGKPFRVSLPSADGTCPGNLDPVFRVFNGPVDNAHGPAHRYTTDPALYAQMQSRGWLPEGAHFCVPPLGPR